MTPKYLSLSVEGIRFTEQKQEENNVIRKFYSLMAYFIQ
jgi:hypothetical protein